MKIANLPHEELKFITFFPTIIHTSTTDCVIKEFFINLIFEGFSWNDYFVGVIKGFVFGIIISVIACYKGNKTKEGAVGIKDTTISTVVLSCIYILIFNFVLTWLLS